MIIPNGMLESEHNFVNHESYIFFYFYFYFYLYYEQVEKDGNPRYDQKVSRLDPYQKSNSQFNSTCMYSRASYYKLMMSGRPDNGLDV